MDPKMSAKPITDIDQMSETPTRRTHHRRAQSETFFRFDDDILLDDVVADFDLSSLDLPVPDDVQVKQSSGPSLSNTNTSHFRSLSVDADFFDGLSLGGGDDDDKGGAKTHSHRHSNSMDEGSVSSFENNANKGLAPHKLAELSLIDPKRAKRFTYFIFAMN